MENEGDSMLSCIAWTAGLLKSLGVDKYNEYVYMDRRGGHSRFESRLLQVISSSSTNSEKLFECVGEHYEIMTASRERQRFTHVWPGIRVYLPQPPEFSN